MKKLILLLLLSPVFLIAQQNAGEMVGTAGLGHSLLGTLANLSDADGSNNTTVTPAFVANFDYGITENMSFGLSAGYQSVNLRIEDRPYINADNQTVTESFDAQYSRLSIGARALFHYSKKENFDMYSGLRFGYQNYMYSDDSADPSYDVEFERAGVMGVQVILFGARGYFNESIGFNAELAIGAPYLIMGGISYRFGGKE